MAIKSRSGFTLIEMMVALVILSVIGIAVANVFRFQHQAQARQNTGVERTMNVRAAVDMIAREVRNAGADPRNTAGAGFVKVTPKELKWTADLNGDGDIDDVGGGVDETVRYFYDAQQQAIFREVDGVESLVADQVTDLKFSYFDEDLKTTGAASKVKHVGVSVTYETPGDVMPGELQTRIAIRNSIWLASAGGNNGSGGGGSGGGDDGGGDDGDVGGDDDDEEDEEEDEDDDKGKDKKKDDCKGKGKKKC